MRQIVASSAKSKQNALDQMMKTRGNKLAISLVIGGFSEAVMKATLADTAESLLAIEI